MKERNWKYKITGNWFGPMVIAITTAVSGGFTFWLYTAHDGAFVGLGGLFGSAYITDISELNRSKVGRGGINYSMTYEYEVDGTHYTGKYGPLANSIEVGRSIRIKYDPSAPENSTGFLAPSGNDLALVIIGTILAVPGFFMSGILGLLRRLLRGLHRSEIPDYAPPEEKRTAPPKAPAPSACDIVMGVRNILRTLAPILIFLLFGFILMLIQNAIS